MKNGIQALTLIANRRLAMLAVLAVSAVGMAFAANSKIATDLNGVAPGSLRAAGALWGANVVWGASSAMAGEASTVLIDGDQF